MRRSSVVRSAFAAVASASMLLLAGSASAQAPAENKALNQPVTASSVERPERNGPCRLARNGCAASNATDGDPDTRWGSDWAEGQWVQVDLGRPRAVDIVQVSWHLTFPLRYRISTSVDGATFTDVTPLRSGFRIGSGEYVQTTGFAAQSARYVRVTSVERFWPQLGISLWELRVAGPPDPEVPPPSPPPPADAPPAPIATGEPVAPSGSPAFDTTKPSAAPPAPAPRRRRLSPFPTVRIKGMATDAGARVDLLQVKYARGASVRVVCRGTGCSRRIVRRLGSGRVPSMRGFFKAGTVIEVFVTRRGHLGKYTRFVIRKGTKAPRRTDSCVTHGASRPTSCARPR